MIAVAVVGICGACGGQVMLQLEHGRRSAACANCPTRGIDEDFFKACGLGDAARIGQRERAAARRVIEGSAFSAARYRLQVANAGKTPPTTSDPFDEEAL